MRHMVVIVPELTGYASIRHVAVSLPYAAQLIDGVKYMLPDDVKPPEGGTERRRQRARGRQACAPGPVGAEMRQRRAARREAAPALQAAASAPWTGTAWRGRARARSTTNSTRCSRKTEAAASLDDDQPCSTPA